MSEHSVEMIDSEERKSAGLMPMHPAILRMRRRRRWRRIAVWEAVCVVAVACGELGMPGELDAWAPWYARGFVYGMCMVPVLALNLWFLPRDRARARAFELEWARAPSRQIEDVVAFDDASARSVRVQTGRRDEGRQVLLLVLLIVVFCFGLTYWLVYDRPGASGMGEALGPSGLVSGVVALLLVPGGVMKYVGAKGALYRIRQERRELLLIREHLSGDEGSRSGGLSHVSESDEMEGAVSVIKEEEESAR